MRISKRRWVGMAVLAILSLASCKGGGVKGDPILRLSADEALEQGKEYRVGYRLLDAAQREHHLMETGRGVRTGNGRPASVEGFVFDQTEQEQARQDSFTMIVEGILNLVVEEW